MSAVVITGIGVVSPFGIGITTFFDGLVSARTAVRPIASFDASRFPVNHAAEVPIALVEAPWLAASLHRDQDDPALVRAGEAGWFRDRKVAWALLAAREAWDMAGLGAADLDLPLSLGLGLEQALLPDFAPIFKDGAIRWHFEPGTPFPSRDFVKKVPHPVPLHKPPLSCGPAARAVNFFRTNRVAPEHAHPRQGEAAAPVGTVKESVRFRTPVDLSVRALKAILGLRGRPVLHVSACAAGALAIAHGAALIQRDSAALVLCGATDAMINPLGLGGMIRLGATSPRNTPDACRPFDRRRDGLVLGEGAAIFVLEAQDRARARGARILARVRGWGSTQDGYRATAPRPDGAAAARAMMRALELAGVPAAEVDYINAHGTGTLLNDPAEARAIRSAIGSHAEAVPVSSIKGAVGHAMAAAGALELAACLLPFERGLVPGTVNYQQPDPDCPLRILGGDPIRHNVRYALSNSFGFGGQNASVLLEAP